MLGLCGSWAVDESRGADPDTGADDIRRMVVVGRRIQPPAGGEDREVTRPERGQPKRGAQWHSTALVTPGTSRAANGSFVPLGGIAVGPDRLQVAVTKEQVQSAPNIQQHGEELSQDDESALYHHYELNYTPPDTESGRRLARR